MGIIVILVIWVIVLLYRGYEYFGCVIYLVDELDLFDIVFFVWDVCGNGCLLGVCGDVLGFLVLVCDLDSFIVYIGVEYGIVVEDIVVIV